MWPLDVPAREVLRLPGETVIPWAVFDCRWYLRTYPEVTTAVDHTKPISILTYYNELGQTLGHSPNRMFDEQWHRQTYPHIAEKVAAGHWMSAFDAYCRHGALDRSAHWLFDERGYRDRYPNLTDDVFARLKICNGYDHYLRHGADEDRVGHLLFNAKVYLSHFNNADGVAARQRGVFQHYLDHIEQGGPELRTSIYFDHIWYLQRYPEVAQEIASKRWKCALHHYLCNDTPTAFDPLESFSESWYLERNPGLVEVIAKRSFRNGYAHFLRFGAKELRSPAATINLAQYALQPLAREDLAQGYAPDAFAHWLAIGKAAQFALTKPEARQVSEQNARELFRQSANALLPIAGRFGCRFDCTGEPVVSVVIVVRNRFAATLATIASLRSQVSITSSHPDKRFDIELIIVDCGSEDETRSIGRYIPGARTLRFEWEIGWSQAADAGRQLCSSPAVLFLSNEARIAPGSVDRARVRLAAESWVGAVGGMILQANGLIAHAGGIVWNDGAIQDYERDAPSLQPEANFVRDVDFCSSDFLLVRAALLTRLDGFDHDCVAGYEAVDLCLRITQCGYRVVYDPSVMIIQGDPPQTGSPGDHFLRKHAAVLAERFSPGGPDQVFARHSGVKPQRILFIEDTVPLRCMGSGFVRANDLIRVMASAGHAVTVFPMSHCDHDLAQVFGDMPETVEVMYLMSLSRLASFLAARPGYYDTVWIARMHNLTQARPILAQLTAEGMLKAEIVLDTEAITPKREAVRAALVGEIYDEQPAMRAIRIDAEICHQVVAVTQAEGVTLQAFDFPRVSIIGHMIEPKPTTLPFVRRSGLLFVGAIHKHDSPNFDSLIWFVDRVLPLIEVELKWETRLTIAGYVAPGADMSRFDHHSRITLRGQVADLGSLYNIHRVFVAPTRYAAGAPYKVLEAASYGLPVVASKVLCEQSGWRAEQEIVAAAVDDPAAFAASVVALYRDEVRWRAIREGALQRLRQENGRADFAAAVNSVLKTRRRTDTNAMPAELNNGTSFVI